MSSSSDDRMDSDSPVNSMSLLDPETLVLLEQVKHSAPGLFVSGWEADEEGIAIKDMMDPGEQLLTAAEDGEVSKIQELLTSDPSLLSVRDCDQYAPLHRASYNNHPEAAKYLLSQGADPCALTEQGWTPLHCAACWGSFDVAQVLLADARVDVNAKTHGKLTPLHLAVACTEDPKSAFKTAELLVQQPNVDLKAVSGAGETPEQIARRTSKQMIQLFESC